MWFVMEADPEPTVHEILIDPDVVTIESLPAVSTVILAEVVALRST